MTDEDVLGDEPIISGTPTPVRAIVELWRRGIGSEEFTTRLPHVAVTTEEAGLSGSTDGEQFSRAISERKTLLTHTLKLPERLLPARNTEGSSLH